MKEHWNVTAKTREDFNVRIHSVNDLERVQCSETQPGVQLNRTLEMVSCYQKSILIAERSSIETRIPNITFKAHLLLPREAIGNQSLIKEDCQIRG